MREFAHFTLKKVLTPTIGFIAEAAFAVLMSCAAIPGGTAIGGSYLAYRVGFPLNVPVGTATFLLTAGWFTILAATIMWHGKTGDRWRQRHQSEGKSAGT